MLPKVERLIRDRDLFCRLLPVTDKQSNKQVPFAALPAQEKVWRALDRSNRVIVVKARQMGISYAVRAWQFHRAYASTDPVKFAVLSFHDRSAKNLRRLDRQWLNALPDLMRRPTKEDSATDTIFSDTGAGFSAFTTGGRGGTRSFAFTGAHLSEFAFYLDPDEVLAQVVATVGDGPIVIESTVNAPGDAFHRLVEGAPQNGWEVVFLPWFEHGAYRHEPPQDYTRTPDEARLAALHGLDDHQLAWRRAQVATLGEHKFTREFPATIQDCFAGVTKSAYFSSEALADVEAVHFHPGDPAGAILEEADPEDYYVIGADPAGGTGGDYSAMQVVSCATLQPVFSWRSNTVAPHEFAAKLVEVASEYTTLYGAPLMLVESQNHGHAVLRELHHFNYKPLWVDGSGKPWVTSHKSKIDAYDGLRELVDGGMIARMDAATLMELRSIQITRVSPEAPQGLHDDLAMALALAYRAYRDAPSAKKRQSRAKVMDEMAAQVRARKTKSRALPWARNP
jgi:hypothetical protein